MSAIADQSDLPGSGAALPLQSISPIISQQPPETTCQPVRVHIFQAL